MQDSVVFVHIKKANLKSYGLIIHDSLLPSAIDLFPWHLCKLCVHLWRNSNQCDEGYALLQSCRARANSRCQTPSHAFLCSTDGATYVTTSLAGATTRLKQCSICKTLEGWVGKSKVSMKVTGEKESHGWVARSNHYKSILQTTCCDVMLQEC